MSSVSYSKLLKHPYPITYLIVFDEFMMISGARMGAYAAANISLTLLRLITTFLVVCIYIYLIGKNFNLGLKKMDIEFYFTSTNKKYFKRELKKFPNLWENFTDKELEYILN